MTREFMAQIGKKGGSAKSEKKAAAVRQTAAVIIEAAKLEVQVHKLKKSSSLDGLFPNLDGMKQLGDGEKTETKGPTK